MVKYEIWNRNRGYCLETQEALIKKFALQGKKLKNNKAFEYAIRENDKVLFKMRNELDVCLKNEIVGITTIETEDDVVHDYFLCGNNISDCLYDEDITLWYVDEKDDFRGEEKRESGVSKVLYREFKANVNESTKTTFLESIRNGTCTKKDVRKYTRKIGDRVVDACDWNIQIEEDVKN